MALVVVRIVGSIGNALLESLQADFVAVFVVVGVVVGPAGDLIVMGC